MAATKNWLSTNSKLKRDGIYSWGIPAYKAADGFITCPWARDCIKGCYARQGFYVMPSVSRAQEERLSFSRKRGATFVATISAEIKRRKIKRVRIHDSGDFYSLNYLAHWCCIARQNTQTRFYAYTKAIPLVRLARAYNWIPENLHLIFSEGGKCDAEINRETEAHSRVFENLKNLKASGYADAHKRDLPAIRGEQRVGLVYHGHKSKAWATV